MTYNIPIRDECIYSIVLLSDLCGSFLILSFNLYSGTKRIKVF